MNRRILALCLLIPFSILTAYALIDVGYLGIIGHLLSHSAGWQVFADLVIALVLVLIWLFADAKASGRSPWPWVILTLLLGSFGPLLYLLCSPPTTVNR